MARFASNPTLTVKQKNNITKTEFAALWGQVESMGLYDSGASSQLYNDKNVGKQQSEVRPSSETWGSAWRLGQTVLPDSGTSSTDKHYEEKKQDNSNKSAKSGDMLWIKRQSIMKNVIKRHGDVNG